MELRGVVQTYAWGKTGKTSKVALLHAANIPEFIIDDKIPYAELWMGTHCNGPSTLKKTGQKLEEWINENKNSLGNEVITQFGETLPYLFKVLSVNKALSIQAHPTKTHAEQLHKLYPDIYKDPNHKPELAIALTQFEALCGFRPIAEIKGYVADIPELRRVIGEDLVSRFLKTKEPEDDKQLLKSCFQCLMTCSKDVVVEQLTLLVNKIKTEGDASRLNQLLTTLHLDFPGDVGCFCIYFLNHVILNPGESIYLGPNVPHAYLSGDCIECMACSDNVVRAGLTPKFRDVNTLCEMLEYCGMPASSAKFQPVVEDCYTSLYKPPIPDFAVASIRLPQEVTEYTTKPRNSASILLVVEGHGNCGAAELNPGSIVFLSSKEQLTINSKTKLSIYQACANV
ncbi:hypothetical protein R5R35_000433 [Gryllus longicercus]|uniref:Mannose-6-phosphate isomerase n=1 Tax=Gryllus longicercus TaxID=2509291 RepID=A0AAN9VDF5_9ORTH